MSPVANWSLLVTKNVLESGMLYYSTQLLDKKAELQHYNLSIWTIQQYGQYHLNTKIVYDI